MQVKPKILIIEDERNIASFLGAILTANDFAVLRAENGADGLMMAASHCPDAVILDLGLPDMDGRELIQRIRAWSLMPILVVSARTHETDKVEALDLGADDYITKPFGTSELLARVRTALRHARSRGVSDAVAQSGRFTAGGLTVDFDKHRVYVDGQDAHLTQNEFKLLALLAKHAGRVLTYDTLLKDIWGPGGGGSNQILRVNMANIRRKIEENPAAPKYVFTEIGVGYRMVEGG